MSSEQKKLATKPHKLFQCMLPKCQANNGGRFFSPEPICPQCGLDAANPKFGEYIARLVLIHYNPPTGYPNRGQGYRACDHAKGLHADGALFEGKPNPFHGGTGLLVAVNCPLCMETEEYKDSLALFDD